MRLYTIQFNLKRKKEEWEDGKVEGGRKEKREKGRERRTKGGRREKELKDLDKKGFQNYTER